MLYVSYLVDDFHLNIFKFMYDGMANWRADYNRCADRISHCRCRK